QPRQLDAGAGVYNLQTGQFPDLEVETRAEQPLAKVQQFLDAQRGTPLLFCCDSPGRREAMLGLLQRISVQPQAVPDWRTFATERPDIAITVAPLESGLWLREPALIAVTENQLFAHHVSQTRRRGRQTDNTDFIIKSLTELNPGAPVVHQE